MTTNQLIAMTFPLLTAAAVGLTGLLIRKPWAEHPAEPDYADLTADLKEVATKGHIAATLGRITVEGKVYEPTGPARTIVLTARD